MDSEGRGEIQWRLWERGALGRLGSRTIEVCEVALGIALLNASLPAGGELIDERRGSCRDDRKQH